MILTVLVTVSVAVVSAEETAAMMVGVRPSTTMATICSGSITGAGGMTAGCRAGAMVRATSSLSCHLPTASE